MAESKIPVQSYIKMLTESDIPVKKAMELTRKLYKVFGTPSKLGALNDFELMANNVVDKDDRKAVLAAVRKAGFAQVPNDSRAHGLSGVARLSGPPHHSESPPSSRKRKRSIGDSVNEYLPAAPPVDDEAAAAALDFKEILDEENLARRSVVINRAPIMSAWALVVAERQGFQRAEALSIASVYTEMNALSKGVSLGVYKEKQAVIEGGNQPSLYRTKSQQWRALLNGTPALPTAAFSYISRSLRQTMPFVVGALRLLADSYNPSELNEKGYSLYCDFRPDVSGWGQRAAVKCQTILDLRKTEQEEGPSNKTQRIQHGMGEPLPLPLPQEGEEEQASQPDRCKAKEEDGMEMDALTQLTGPTVTNGHELVSQGHVTKHVWYVLEQGSG
ncbi:hypothetical protein CYLTODRAFT_406103 [Cylindrobasidium torrendii FP15055 ss-10]|uniref:Uncharacterized protein n=1 Tax=Cylindrobasidium torrendii FP15055 ss-10 TaxID=1314674 RepID=A0A0D7BUW8_9AGAR|nr:hypothetical protein CYLTODRAFT_406103 [Cylindrobasidium torrendii FP15055 ss-10]